MDFIVLDFCVHVCPDFSQKGRICHLIKIRDGKNGAAKNKTIKVANDYVTLPRLALDWWEFALGKVQWSFLTCARGYGVEDRERHLKSSLCRGWDWSERILCLNVSHAGRSIPQFGKQLFQRQGTPLMTDKPRPDVLMSSFNKSSKMTNKLEENGKTILVYNWDRRDCEERRMDGKSEFFVRGSIRTS